MKWQAIAVLHVYGDTLDLPEFAERYSLPGATVARKGDPAPRGGSHLMSTLKATLADATSSAALHRSLARNLDGQSEFYAAVQRGGGAAVIDIGLMVGGDGPRTVTFEPDLLAAFTEAGVGLHVTAYPCSDDA
jgi:hypothetical protein